MGGVASPVEMVEMAAVVQVAQELAAFARLAMSPDASRELRAQAYEACEHFKESSPLCAQAGLLLALGEGAHHSDEVRHFGLQLMEHTVKYRWNQISQQEKVFIKENAMKLVSSGGWDAGHANDALARVVVEMAKREWPQQWPSLLAELSDACQLGNRQTEIVLHVLLRLVEDVATLQTLDSNQRRKDIYAALTANMAEIFAFFLRLAELHVGRFRDRTREGDADAAAQHRRVVQVVLLTLTGFVEWVSMSHVAAHDGRLLQILCALLCDDAFRLPAAECLLQIVNRKGQVKERAPLAALFERDALARLHAAVAQPHPDPPDERRYLFLKRLAQVAVGMTQQLTSLWGREDGTAERPRHLDAFLDALLRLSRHPSLTLAHAASAAWSALLKHDRAQRDPLVLSYVPALAEAVAPRLLKVTLSPPRTSSVRPDAYLYAALDHDGELDFGLFFARCRTDLLDLFRQITVAAPLVSFAYVDRWLRKVLSEAAVRSHDTRADVHDPVYLEWEALSQLLDAVLSRILSVSERPSVQSGLSLLELCLNSEPRDPLLLSLLLSFVSALFVFLSMSSCQTSQGNRVAATGAALLPRVLDKIFAALVYTGRSPGEADTKDGRSRAVKNVRRHAASLMVKIGCKYPLFLLSVFDRIHSTVRRLCTEPCQLSTLEKITLQEALLLISNHFCDYDRQKSIIAETLGPCGAQWAAMAPHFENAPALMRFVGLDGPPVRPSAHDVTGQNRSNLLHCVNLILSVTKRCTWPDDPEKAFRGGFGGGVTPGGNPVWRNPCAEHVLPILPHVLSLVRALNQLYDPRAMRSLSEGYRGAYGLLETERQSLLGLTWVGQTDPLDPNWKRPFTPLDRMQHFLTDCNDLCCHLLGSAGQSVGRELYQIPGIGTAVVQTVLSGLEHVPDHRLRPVVRHFLRPFVSHCPTAFHADVLMPVLAHVSGFMYDRLCARWQYIMTLYESGRFEDESGNDTQEVIEDMLNRNLTREYLDLLKVALIGGCVPVSPEDESMDAEDAACGMDVPAAPPVASRSASLAAQEHVGELGNMILACEQTCVPVLNTVLGALWWNDSVGSMRACSLLSSCVRALAARPPDAAGPHASLPVDALTSVLQALQQHGQHDANQAALLSLGVQIYESLRPRCPAMLEVLRRIPNVGAADLHRFDERLSAPPTKGNKIDKGKKDLFKRMTGQLIGRSVGQRFRKEVHIADLPTLRTAGPRERSGDLLDGRDNDVINIFAENTVS